MENFEAVIADHPEITSSLRHGVQWTSDEDILSSQNGKVVRGGEHNIPTDFRDSLEHPFIDTDDVSVDYSRLMDQHVRGDTYEKNKFIASFLETGVTTSGDVCKPSGDRQYMTGTTINDKVLTVGREYLHFQRQAQEQQKQIGVATPQMTEGEVPRRYWTSEPMGREGLPWEMELAEPFLSAAAPDKAAVMKAFAQREHGTTFIMDLAAHDWADDGAAAGKLFTYDDDDFEATDPDNPLDVARSERVTRTMSMVANVMTSDGGYELFTALRGIGDVREDENTTIGKTNPLLTRALSRSFSPYLDDIMGSGVGEHQGWDAIHGDATRAARLFDLLNTDEEAGEQIQSSVMIKQQEWNHRWGADKARGSLTSPWLQMSGKLAGLSDKGAATAIGREISDENEAAEAAQQRKGNAAYNVVQVVGFGVDLIPGSKLVTKVGTKAFSLLKTAAFMKSGDKTNLENILLGSPSSAAGRGSGSAKLTNSVIEYQALDAGGDLRERLHGNPKYGAYLNDLGEIKDFDEIVDMFGGNRSEIKGANALFSANELVSNMAAASGIHFNGIDLYDEAYRNARG